LWLARYFKGSFVRGSVRKIEDIFLSEWRGGSKGHGRIAGSRNGIQESAGFNKNIKKSGPLMMGDRGLVLVLLVLVLA
jgi:hypothetical protein